MYASGLMRLTTGTKRMETRGWRRPWYRRNMGQWKQRKRWTRVGFYLQSHSIAVYLKPISVDTHRKDRLQLYRFPPLFDSSTSDAYTRPYFAAFSLSSPSWMIYSSNFNMRCADKGEGYPDRNAWPKYNSSLMYRIMTHCSPLDHICAHCAQLHRLPRSTRMHTTVNLGIGAYKVAR